MRRAGVGNAVQGEYGLPHQRARWFAMTGYREVRRISGGGVWSPRPTEGLKCLRRGDGDAVPYERMVVGAVRAGRCGHRPLRIFCRDSKKCGALTGAAGVG